MLRTLTWAILLLGSLVLATQALAQDDTFDFSITPQFLKQLADGHTIQPTIRLQPQAHTKTVHSLASDCEMHLASTSGDELGSPNDVVIEPPNLCKFPPPSGTWGTLFDKRVLHKDCDVVGFPRIFTEHAQNGGDKANPNHVLEIHPALSMQCGDGNEISFAKFLKYFDGMRAISPKTATSCISGRELQMRLKDGSLQFKENGGQCGNFAIVEVSKLNPDWIKETGGGHSAIARVSPDGQSSATLKIYTLSPSEADTWIAKVKTDGLGSDRVFLHGLLTYDYFAMLKIFEKMNADSPDAANWQQIPFPLALVVFGFPSAAPWTEE